MEYKRIELTDEKTSHYIETTDGLVNIKLVFDCLDCGKETYNGESGWLDMPYCPECVMLLEEFNRLVDLGEA